MKTKYKHKEEAKKSTTFQRNVLIVCAVIMGLYIAIVYFVARGAFVDFTAIQMLLLVISTFFIWHIGNSRAIAYFVLFFSILGAGTAVVLTLYYLFIIGKLNHLI